MKLNGWGPGQQPRPRIQTIAQRAPAVAPQKNHGGRKHNFSTSSIGQARREPRDRPKTQEEILKLNTSIAASPSMSRAWRFWASSAHSREADSDSFLACVAKTKQRLSAASTRRCTPSPSSALLGTCQPDVCVRCCFFPIS